MSNTENDLVGPGLNANRHSTETNYDSPLNPSLEFSPGPTGKLALAALDIGFSLSFIFCSDIIRRSKGPFP
jgi:hypothetical protein